MRVFRSGIINSYPGAVKIVDTESIVREADDHPDMLAILMPQYIRDYEEKYACRSPSNTIEIILPPLGGKPFNAVRPNYLVGTYEAVEHLIQQGHTRIAFLGRPELVNRFAAYRIALETYGLPVNPEWVSCGNVYHGHGGVDAFGKKFTSSNALSMRYYFIQSYKLHRKYGRTIWLHAHNKFYPFVHDFADLWAPGEEQAGDFANSPFFYYLEKIAMEEYQSAWNAEIRGVGIQMISQQERVSGLMQELRPLRDKISNPVTLQHSISAALLHDFKVWESAPRLKEKHPLGRVWTIKSKLNMDQAEFHGYWVSSAVRSDDPAIYCSWYSWKPGSAPLKRLLVAVNASRTEKAAELVIDWKQLGIDQSKVKMTELWSGKKLAVGDLKTLVIQPHCFALVEMK